MNPADHKTAKDNKRREKNRQTARVSRIRKAEYVAHLESEVKRLQELVHQLQGDLVLARSQQQQQAPQPLEEAARPQQEAPQASGIVDFSCAEIPEAMIMDLFDLQS